MSLAVSSLVLGQEVAIGRSGQWGTTNWQGVYTVSKVNKMKVVLARNTDGYERTFSVKRNSQIPKTPGGYADNVYIASVTDMDADTVARAERRIRDGIWADLEQAAKRKDLQLAVSLMAQLS